MNGSKAGMAGQALVEALLGLTCLGVFFVLIAMLGRLQDIGLQSSFASRHAAFASTRREMKPDDLRNEVRDLFFHEDRQRWLSWGGGSMVEQGQANAQVDTVADVRPNAAIQIGGDTPAAKPLREELMFPDRGAATSRVRIRPRLAVTPPAGARAAAPGYTGLAEWMQIKLSIERYLVILTGAGHARTDDAAQAVIASSDHAWRSTADRSQRAGTAVNAALRRLDEPWKRPAVSFDWLQRWSDAVPADRLDAATRSAP